MHPRRDFGIVEAPKLIAISPVVDEPQPSPAEMVLKAEGPIDQFKAFLRYAEARVPPDAPSAVLLEAVDQTKQLLGRLTKRLRQSGGDHGDTVVVNLP